MLIKRVVNDRKIVLILITILCLYLNYYCMHKYPTVKLTKQEQSNCNTYSPNYYSSYINKNEIEN